MSTPSITPAQVVSLITALVGLYVSQGIIKNGTGQLVVGTASVVLPFGWALADAIIRHGRARALPQQTIVVPSHVEVPPAAAAPVPATDAVPAVQPNPLGN